MRITKFGAVWCGPCKMMDKILDQFAAEHPEVVIERVDVEDKPDLASQLGITNVPTIIIDRENGTPAFRTVGAIPVSKLKEHLGL